MITNILYKSDILDGLFTEKDFEFLKNSNSRQEELEFKVKMSDLKRDKIIECINKTDSSNPLNYEYIASAQSAFESINTVIRNLTMILDEFNDIEKNILELVVKKDANEILDTDNIVNELYNKIYNFKIKQKNIEEENYKYDLIVDNFLNNIEINKENIQLNDSEQILSPNKEKYVVPKNNAIDNTFQLEDNLVLRISEKEKKIFLPYTKSEIEKFLSNYPDEYKSYQDVIEQEFVADFSLYNKHPVLSRFRESYSLSRNREMKSAIDSLKFAMDMMFKNDLNPTIIAAVKSQKQLEEYIECLENNKLEDFKYFSIIFEINPL